MHDSKGTREREGENRSWQAIGPIVWNNLTAEPWTQYLKSLNWCEQLMMVLTIHPACISGGWVLFHSFTSPSLTFHTSSRWRHFAPKKRSDKSQTSIADQSRSKQHSCLAFKTFPPTTLISKPWMTWDRQCQLSCQILSCSCKWSLWSWPIRGSPAVFSMTTCSKTCIASHFWNLAVRNSGPRPASKLRFCNVANYSSLCYFFPSTHVQWFDASI